MKNKPGKKLSLVPPSIWTLCLAALSQCCLIVGPTFILSANNSQRRRRRRRTSLHSTLSIQMNVCCLCMYKRMRELRALAFVCVRVLEIVWGASQPAIQQKGYTVAVVVYTPSVCFPHRSTVERKRARARALRLRYISLSTTDELSTHARARLRRIKLIHQKERRRNKNTTTNDTLALMVQYTNTHTETPSTYILLHADNNTLRVLPTTKQ